MPIFGGFFSTAAKRKTGKKNIMEQPHFLAYGDLSKIALMLNDDAEVILSDVDFDTALNWHKLYLKYEPQNKVVFPYSENHIRYRLCSNAKEKRLEMTLRRRGTEYVEIPPTEEEIKAYLDTVPEEFRLMLPEDLGGTK